MIPRSVIAAGMHSATSRAFQRARSLATSAQKRKWLKEHGGAKPFPRQKKHAVAATTNHTKDAAAAPPNWRPLFFLGVFPVFLSIVVVLNRDDLREEVNDKGIGRFVEDYKRWRRAPPKRAPPSTEQQQEQQQQQAEHKGEYERMLNQLEREKENVPDPGTDSNNSNQ
mmetsp:Transcript_16184/g.44813  ORF Transcript_16184/g.44813 Transcript_16184/m.44813 type:complete len:168 (-) Transcript_16184:67-570(-)